MNQYFKKPLLSLLLGGITSLGLYAPAMAQSASGTPQDPAMKIYRAAATKINDLVHTKLDVRFDYAKQYLYGKAWITLKPHFYPTDTLTLDAKGMDIKEVALVNAGKTLPLKYQYDGMQLRIQLDKTYENTTSYTIYIAYTAKPNELKVHGSKAITDAKGLYFINPYGKNPNKPIQIWTQGETEASSVWFPTIDKTNQKTTQEISMTVDKKYVTLSNGKLVSQKSNADGTRTDTWKMDLPHAPYLFMMAVGDYAIVKDQWRGKEVNYYVEKPFEKYAKDIFGNTPEMMTFYSKILGYDYPWVKYSQVVGRDYVSGAMENTTATLHGEFMQKTDRELLDNNNYNEAVIAHELFHHWFGDLATAESWSNLTVNESFADYSEYLWMEHKYGKDAADEHGLSAAKSYFSMVEYTGDKPLVRFHYRDKEEMFDQVTYQKGGRILNMLRNYLGDDAFFKSMNLYLKTNAFKATEAHHFRLAAEEISGQDLNWFFNQWYFGQGFPILDINYVYNDAAQTVSVILQQQQKDDKTWQLPMAIDIYAGGKKERHQVMMNDKVDTFTFVYATKPDFVNVDADKVILSQKKDHRDISTYIFQYANAPQYMDRREAIEACLKQQTTNPAALATLKAALKDKYHGLRELTIAGLKLDNATVKDAVLPIIINLAQKDENSLVRAAALKQLGQLQDDAYAPLLEAAATKEKSYAAAGAALQGLSELQPDKAYALAKQMANDSKGGLATAIAVIFAQKGDESDVPFFVQKFDAAGGQDKIGPAIQYMDMLAGVNTTATVIQGMDRIKEMVDQMNNPQISMYMVNIMQAIGKKKQADASAANGTSRDELNKQAEYILKMAQSISANTKEEE
jgi:aminopeptidase N